MFLTVLFLALLFIAGLVNILFHFPPHEIYAWLQYFFPTRTNACKTNSTDLSSSSASSNKQRNVYQKDELRKVFSTFDKNGDGFITRQELRESLRNIRISMTDKEIDEIVVKFDSNGDGLLDFDEFCLLTSESMAGHQVDEKESAEKESEEEENLKEAFDVFDKDEDGLISVEELALVLTSLGLREGMKIEDCKAMIKKVDMDGDGKVDFKEFKKMMKGGNLLLAA